MIQAKSNTVTSFPPVICYRWPRDLSLASQNTFVQFFFFYEHLEKSYLLLWYAFKLEWYKSEACFYLVVCLFTSIIQSMRALFLSLSQGFNDYKNWIIIFF